MSSKDNIQISHGQIGMERQLHNHMQDDKTYTFARNANLETELNTFGLTNEQSNLLCSRFKPGYVVVGHKYDSLNNRVWFFLSEDSPRNPKKPLSEIGYIQINSNYTSEDDLEIDCGCDVKSLLREPLEGKDQKELCKYITWMEDCPDNPCLNFDINYPIDSIEIKQEVCGQTMMFTDRKNPPRYIILDKKDYYRKKPPTCSNPNPIVEDCLDCERMLLFPNYKIPFIQPLSIEFGGSLKRGVYEFYVAYCDKLGNEMTEYVSATNAINLFDPQNIQMNSATRFDRTSYSIKVEIDNLDTKYNYYKIAVIEKTDVTGVTSIFNAGVYPINQNVVTYSTNGEHASLQRMTSEQLFATKPVYKKFGGLTASNGYVFGYDYEVEKEWNLQKVVNLMGTFLKWQTVEAGEDLYKDGVNNALYRGYMRDEVYPFGIRFITKNGYRTSVFPFIARLPFEQELEEIAETDNTRKSIESPKANCSGTRRTKFWQFYNTAKSLGFSSTSSANVSKDIKTVKKKVSEDYVDNKVYESGSKQNIEIILSENFKNLKDFISDNIDNIKRAASNSEYYSPLLKEIIEEAEVEANKDEVFKGEKTLSFPTFTTRDATIYNSIKDKYCNPKLSNGTDDNPNYNVDTCELINTRCVCDSNNNCKCSGVCGDVVETKGSNHNSLRKLFIEKIENPTVTLEHRSYNHAFLDTAQKYPEYYKHHKTEGRCSMFPGKKKYPLDIRASLCLDRSRKRAGYLDYCGDFKLNFGTFIKAEVNTNTTPDTALDLNNYKGMFFYPSFVGTVVVGCESKRGARTVSSVRVLVTENGDKHEINGGKRTRDEANADTGWWHNINDPELGGNDVITPDYLARMLLIDGVEYKPYIDALNSILYRRLDGFFDNGINKSALWYDVDLVDKEEVFMEITPIEPANYVDNSILKEVDVKHRLAQTHTGNYYYDLVGWSRALVFSIDNTGKPSLKACIPYNPYFGLFLYLNKSTHGDTVKVCIEAPIISKYFYSVEESGSYTQGYSEFTRTHHNYMVTTATYDGCFDIKIRPKEYYKAKVNFSNMQFGVSIPFTTECYFKAPSNVDCGVVSHRYGYFSYWESVQNYPDNPELWDSSSLTIDKQSLLDNQNGILKHEPSDLKTAFLNYFKDNQTVLNPDVTKFCNRPIRHYKFPDNVVAPFMTNNPLLDFEKSRIYPLGVTIHDKTVKAFLDIAVSNNLINQEQRDSIIGYEIVRGDRGSNKSVVMKGIINDMYEDTSNQQSGKTILFRNFPYNSLGKNTLLSSDNDRSDVINHPYGSSKNNRFSLISPDIYLNRQKPGTEITIDGYVFGKATLGFQEVKNHAEWVILGKKSYDEASKLANMEIATEIALNVAQMTVQSAVNGGWFIAGVAVGSGALGTIAGMALAAAYEGVNSIKLYATKALRIESQWLQTFEDKGIPVNFASMIVSEKGWYNYFTPNNDKKQYLRGLVNSVYLSNGVDNLIEAYSDGSNLQTEVIQVNNIDREKSLYFSLGDYHFVYPDFYKNYDNVDVSRKNASRNSASRLGCYNITDALVKIASPYVTLKNYVPDQYGKIESIKWLSTNHRQLFMENDSNSVLKTNQKSIFGGDIYITRVDLKNKFPFFNKTAVGLPQRTPFKYSTAGTVGYPTYYVDYKTSQNLFGFDEHSFVNTNHKLDCYKPTNSKYEQAPAKFYTHAYGLPHFLVESEINCEFRYTGDEYHEQYASAGVSVKDWVQEDNVSIAHDNIFLYNDVYSRTQSGLANRTLPSYYEKEKWDCIFDAENGVAWSEPDNSEVSLSDPWLVWRPFNIYRFPFNYGKLLSLNPIESTQVLGRFYNNTAIFNAVDTLRDRLNAKTEQLGTGGIFATRPVQFSFNELGETGSQHKSMVSCEFGHFWVDAKRGKVYHLKPNGQGLTAISDYKTEGGESGNRKWFKRHLPFKILKENITDKTPCLTCNNTDVRYLNDTHLDNPKKGIGILMWWDSKFKRLFITKRDYIVKPKYKGTIRYRDGEFYNEDDDIITVQDLEYFEDVSWTMAYSPIYNSWVSFYDFKPDYAIGYNDYFQTGINYPPMYDGDEQNEYRKGLWSHLLTNKSYQVFYQDYYPFEIELPIKNTYTNNVLKDVKLWMTSHRYTTDNYDYSSWREKGFNKLIIYNETNNSGLLHLNYGNTYKKSQFPIAISNTEQGVQATHTEESINVNYFYNRVQNEENHVPVWINDPNEINKSLNPKALSFTSKKVLERLRGDWFQTRWIQDNTSQFKQVFKWMISKETPYN